MALNLLTCPTVIEKGEKPMSTEPFTKRDILYGLIVPLIVALIILLFPVWVRPALDGLFPPPDMMTGDPGSPWSFITVIFTHGLAQMVMFGIPLIMGLIWNKWAGGAAGFLLGSIYALYVNDVYAAYVALGYIELSAGFMVQEITNLGFVVSAMLVGYMSGALNRNSYSFRRMIVSALIAGAIASAFQLWAGVISPISMATDIPYVAFTILLPKIIYGIIIPIFVTLFGWFGISPRQMT